MKNFKRPYTHKNGPTFFCNKIAVHDIKHIHQKFYENNDKTVQDFKLCHFMLVMPISRKLSGREITRNNRSLCVNYFLPTRINNTKLQVCNKFFLKVLNVKKDRVIRVAKFIFVGNAPKERRGI